MKYDNPLRSSDVRAHNQKFILSRIYEARKNGISQSELVTETGLKAPTIFRIFTILEEQQLIEILENDRNTDISEKQTRKGRRPVVYTVRKTALYTIGLEFWAASISLGIFNFSGERIFNRIETLKAHISINDVIESIVLYVNEALESMNIEREKIAGIGIAAPGQVDLINRTVINYSRIKGMKNTPLADELEKRLGFSVILHNNCSVMALSEFNNGGFDHQGSLFTFLLRYGVNGAFVDQHGIYTTGNGITLETGHVPVDSGGPVCNCGLSGCLESLLRDLDTEDIGKQQYLFQGLESRLAAGDAEAGVIAARAADYLFMVTKSIMRFFNPRSFLILGNGELVSLSIAENLQRRWQNEPDEFVTTTPNIFSRAYDPLVFQQGASDLVMAHYFS